MPNCFQLTKIGENEPSKLNDIDIEICQLLNRPVDDRFYCAGWFDTIGFMLACDLDWNEIRERLVRYKSNDLLKVLDFLEKNYSPNAWAEIGRR